MNILGKKSILYLLLFSACTTTIKSNIKTNIALLDTALYKLSKALGKEDPNRQVLAQEIEKIKELINAIKNPKFNAIKNPKYETNFWENFSQKTWSIFIKTLWNFSTKNKIGLLPKLIKIRNNGKKLLQQEKPITKENVNDFKKKIERVIELPNLLLAYDLLEGLQKQWNEFNKKGIKKINDELIETIKNVENTEKNKIKKILKRDKLLEALYMSINRAYRTIKKLKKTPLPKEGKTFITKLEEATDIQKLLSEQILNKITIQQINEILNYDGSINLTDNPIQKTIQEISTLSTKAQKYLKKMHQKNIKIEKLKQKLTQIQKDTLEIEKKYKNNLSIIKLIKNSSQNLEETFDKISQELNNLNNVPERNFTVEYKKIEKKLDNLNNLDDQIEELFNVQKSYVQNAQLLLSKVKDKNNATYKIIQELYQELYKDLKSNILAIIKNPDTLAAQDIIKRTQNIATKNKEIISVIEILNKLKDDFEKIKKDSNLVSDLKKNPIDIENAIKEFENRITLLAKVQKIEEIKIQYSKLKNEIRQLAQDTNIANILEQQIGEKILPLYEQLDDATQKAQTLISENKLAKILETMHQKFSEQIYDEAVNKKDLLAQIEQQKSNVILLTELKKQENILKRIDSSTYRDQIKENLKNLKKSLKTFIMKNTFPQKTKEKIENAKNLIKKIEAEQIQTLSFIKPEKLKKEIKQELDTPFTKTSKIKKLIEKAFAKLTKGSKTQNNVQTELNKIKDEEFNNLKDLKNLTKEFGLTTSLNQTTGQIRKAAFKYHPDRFAEKSQEEQKKAQERFEKFEPMRLDLIKLIKYMERYEELLNIAQKNINT